MIKLKNPLYWILLPIIILFYILFKAQGQAATLLVIRLILIAGFYLATLLDITTKTVPNKLVLALALAWALVVAPLAFYDMDHALSILFRGGVGFVLAAVVMLAVYLVSKKGLGGGDVKLMSVAGLYLGYDGALTALLYGSVLSAVFAVIMILLKKMTIKDSMPLVPFLYIGILLAEFIR